MGDYFGKMKKKLEDPEISEAEKKRIQSALKLSSKCQNGEVVNNSQPIILNSELKIMNEVSEDARIQTQDSKQEKENTRFQTQDSRQENTPPGPLLIEGEIEEEFSVEDLVKERESLKKLVLKVGDPELEERIKEIDLILQNSEFRIQNSELERWDSNFGPFEWDKANKKLIFDDGVVYTEDEVRQLASKAKGHLLSQVEFDLKKYLNAELVNMRYQEKKIGFKAEVRHKTQDFKVKW